MAPAATSIPVPATPESAVAPLLKAKASNRSADQPGWKREEARQQIVALVAAGDTAAILSAAAAFEAQDDFDFALQLLQTSLSVLEKALGDVHPETLRVMTRIAALLSAVGEYEEAASMSARVAFALKVTVGKGAPETLGAVMDQAHALIALERPDKAYKFFKQALVGYRALYGDLHPNTIACLRETAAALLQDGRIESAAGLEAEAEMLRAKALAANSGEISGTDAMSSSSRDIGLDSVAGHAKEKAAADFSASNPNGGPSAESPVLKRTHPELVKAHHSHQQRVQALQALRQREASRSQKWAIGLQRRASRRTLAASPVSAEALEVGRLEAEASRVDLGGNIDGAEDM